MRIDINTQGDITVEGVPATLDSWAARDLVRLVSGHLDDSLTVTRGTGGCWLVARFDATGGYRPITSARTRSLAKALATALGRKVKFVRA